MTRFLILCMYMMAVSNTASAKLTEQQTIQILKNLPVINSIPMSVHLKSKHYKAEFDGDVSLVTLQDGTRAVFKKMPQDDLGDAHAEVAAFKISQFLGFPRVPPTVIRKIKGHWGSLQLYIEPTLDPTQPGMYEKILNKAARKDVANLKLFYFVFGQWDTGPHNLIVREEENQIKLYAIDNSGIRNHQHVKYGDLPFVRLCYSERLNTQDWDQPFPFDQSQMIQNPSFKNLFERFGNTLPKPVLKNLANRHGPLHFVLHKNSLWIQFHKSDPTFIRSHTDYYPQESMEALKKLDMNVLKHFFSDATGSDFLTSEYLQAFLERKNQVLRAYPAIY